jgi:hypothetical protein
MMNMAMLTFPGLDGLGTAITIRVGNGLVSNPRDNRISHIAYRVSQRSSQ